MRGKENNDLHHFSSRPKRLRAKILDKAPPLMKDEAKNEAVVPILKIKAVFVGDSASPPSCATPARPRPPPDPQALKQKKTLTKLVFAHMYIDPGTNPRARPYCS